MTKRRLSLVLLLVVLVSAVAWLGHQALAVRSDLASVQSQVRLLRTQAAHGDYASAQRSLRQVRGRVADAAGRTNDPLWRAGAAVPLLGRDLSAVRGGALAVEELAHSVLPDVEQLSELLQRQALLEHGTVRLEALPALKPLVDRSSAAAGRVRARLAHLPAPFLPEVRSGLMSLDRQVVQVDDVLGNASASLRILPSMLGANGQRRYLLVVQNNAEARATGGLIGAYAIVIADHGRLSLSRAGSDDDFTIPRVTVPLPPDAARMWQAEGSTQFWYNANLSPHFPDVATIVSGLWTAQTGQRLDGVLSLDPIAMAQLMRPHGIVSLPGGVRVGPDDVADFVMHREYVLFGSARSQAPRKRLLAALAAAVFHSALSGGRPTTTLSAAVLAAQSGHLLLWSTHNAEQAVLQHGLVGGALPSGNTPYLEVLTQNYGGNKLDYYLRRLVQVTRIGDGRIRLAVEVRNDVPQGLPAYMTVRSDRPMPPVPVGQARVAVSVYGALSSRFDEVRLDGRTTGMMFDTDHGHPFGTLVIELPPGATRTVSVLVTEPTGRLDYRQQPLAYSDRLDVQVPHRVIGR